MPGRRRGAIALAIVCFAGAVALTPAEVRSRFAGLPRATAFPAPSSAGALGPVEPRGDPFAPRAFDDPPAAAPAVTTPRFALPAGLGPLPPNAGARAGWPGAAAAALPVAVTAVVIGPHPRAIVIEAGATRLVARGDRLAGATIVAVERAGLALSDGRRLAVSAGPP